MHFGDQITRIHQNHDLPLDNHIRKATPEDMKEMKEYSDKKLRHLTKFLDDLKKERFGLDSTENKTQNSYLSGSEYQTPQNLHIRNLI